MGLFSMEPPRRATCGILLPSGGTLVSIPWPVGKHPKPRERHPSSPCALLTDEPESPTNPCTSASLHSLEEVVAVANTVPCRIPSQGQVPKLNSLLVKTTMVIV